MTSPAATYCPRHPSVETNLRCGRCGELICPRCVVQTPVGGRCPSCARLRSDDPFEPTGMELLKATAAGVGAAIALAGVYVGLLLVLRGMGVGLGIIIGLAGMGWAIGEVVYRASGYNRSRKLQVIAGLSMFLGYMISFVALGPVMTNIGAWIGLAVGLYVAINRTKR